MKTERKYYVYLTYMTYKTDTIYSHGFIINAVSEQQAISRAKYECRKTQNARLFLNDDVKFMED